MGEHPLHVVAVTAFVRATVEEESGCRVEPEALLGLYSKLSPPEMVLLLFRCRHLEGEPRPCSETPEVGWLEPAEALRLVASPASAQRPRDALAPPDGIPLRAYRLRPYEDVSGRLV